MTRVVRGTFPPGSNANHLAHTLAEIVESYCFFPGPILTTQCKRIGKNVGNITLDDLDALAPNIARSVENFTNPQKAETVRKAIVALKE